MATTQRRDSFATLFKKYRLRSEIETLSQFGDLLAQEGLVYENSLFTHWQKGDRTPSDRKVMWIIVKLFTCKKGIRNLEEANSLFRSLGMSDLDKEEQDALAPFLQTVEYSKLREQATHDKLADYTHVFVPHLAATALIGFYSAIVLWWVFLMIYGLRSTPLNLAFGFAYGLVPLVGGFTAIALTLRSKVMRESMKKAILFLGFGVIVWGIGQFIWSLYNFILRVEIPYPSLSDLAYLLSWPLWGIGLYYLSKATRVYNRPEINNRRHILIVSTLAMVITTSYLAIGIAKGGRLITSPDIVRTFFDLAYPILDILILTEAMLLYGTSFRYLRGIYRVPVYILLCGIVVNFIADFGFSYGVNTSTYYNGSWVDLAFTTAFFFILLAIYRLVSLENRRYLTVSGERSLQQGVEQTSQAIVLSRKMNALFHFLTRHASIPR